LEHNNRRTAPPKRGAIIEEPSHEWNDSNSNGQLAENLSHRNRHRMLNSPTANRKLKLYQKEENEPSYSVGNEPNHEQDNCSKLGSAHSFEEPEFVDHGDMFIEDQKFDSTQTDQRPLIRKETDKYIDTGTYTKKSHFNVDDRDSSHTTDYMNKQQLESFQKEPPPYPLPVGYPIFTSTTQMTQSHYFGSDDDNREEVPYEPTLYSPFESLPNPLEHENPNESEFCPPAPPVRQSPASSLPPFELEFKETDSLINQEIKSGGNTPLGDYISLNPDIDKPSPPRLGISKEEGKTEDDTKIFCNNPFELSDEETCPVEPEKKLSPSHVFESTTLEQSLLLGEDSPNLGSINGMGEIKKSLFNSNTFVIKRGSSTPKSPLSPSESVRSDIQSSWNDSESVKHGSLHSPTFSIEHNEENLSDTTQSKHENNDGKLNSPDGPSMQCESLFDVYEDSPIEETQFLKDDTDMDGGRDESIAMDLDYDHLMAYFDSLKESNA
jgi:hypothetical protein